MDIYDLGLGVLGPPPTAPCQGRVPTQAWIVRAHGSHAGVEVHAHTRTCARARHTTGKGDPTLPHVGGEGDRATRDYIYIYSSYLIPFRFSLNIC